jgi:MinD superfamily P-loop ATPase
VDAQRCNFCGKCKDVCRFNAVAVLPRSVIIFDELCHGCGGCALACPTRAITEKPREIGVVEKGRRGSIDFLAGRLNVGEAMAPPLIRLVKQEIPRDRLVLIDASPGTSCPVITAIQDVDYCLLVTEPTPFGLNDLKLAVEMVRKIGKPFGVVINRDGIGHPDTEKYCERQKIPVLIKIPDDRRIAEVYSRGEMIVDLMPEIKSRFIHLLRKLTRHKNSGPNQSRLGSRCG